MVPFRPSGPTVNIDVSSSSQSVQVTSAGSGNGNFRVMNNGSATVWIKFGTSAPTATIAADMPIGSGGCEMFSAMSPIYVAAIAAGATGKVHFTPGDGI